MIESADESDRSLSELSDSLNVADDGLPVMPEHSVTPSQEDKVPSFIDPRELAPNTMLYRKKKRLLISDIKEKEKRTKISDAPPIPKKKDYGTFTGVFVPVFVNMMGTIYWNRVGQLVGNVGIVYSIVIIWCAAIVSLLTIISMSTMATNGELEGNGAYYIISRTIGPEVGLSFAVLLILSHCFSAAAAMLAFGETVTAMYAPNYFTGTSENDVRVIAALVFVAALISTNFIQQMRYAAIVTDVIGIICFLLGVFIRKPGSTEGFLGASMETFKKNAIDTMSFTKFMSNLGLVTPGFTSILACFISSSRVMRPEKMVPRGLFLALLCTFIIWHITIFALGSCGDRDFLSHTLLSPLISFSLEKWVTFFSVVVFVAHRSVHSTIVPRNTITFLSNDNCIPQIKYYSNYTIPFAITAIGVGIGDLNSVVKLNTVFFMTLYAILNFMMYLAGVSHIPSWRPTFPLYNPYLSLLGTVACVSVQFSMNWYVSLIAWSVVTILMIFAYSKKMVNEWGSVDQASTYYIALHNALNLQRIQKNPKLFRINLLTVVAANREFEDSLLPFIDLVLSNEGFCIVSKVLEDSNINLVIEHRAHFNKNISMQHNIFYETVSANDPREGLSKQMLLSGLGSLRPNTLCIDIDDRPAEDIFNMTLDVIDSESFGLILVTRPAEVLKAERCSSDRVDVWWLSDDGGLTLLVAYLAARTAKKKLRVYSIANVDAGDTVEEVKERVKKLLTRFRITAEFICVEISERNSQITPYALNEWQTITQSNVFNNAHRRFLLLSDVIRQYSTGSFLTVSTLLIPELAMDSSLYVDLLKIISNIPPTFAFVRGTGESVLSWKL